MKRFRFGGIVRSGGSRGDWVDKARKLEDLGYSVLTVADHLADIFAPIPALVSAAEATKSLRVGTTVLNNDFRHPVLVAREAATVDLLTDGRFELGVGAGYMKSEYDQAGLRFDPGGTRVERLAVGLTGITFRRGGVEPDVSGCKPAEVTERLQLVREAAGDRFDRLELNALVLRVIVTGDRRQAAAELQSRWTQLTPDEILQSPYVLLGTVDQLAEDLRFRRERWGISYYVTLEPYIDALAPVVARLAGS